MNEVKFKEVLEEGVNVDWEREGSKGSGGGYHYRRLPVVDTEVNS